jgi:MIP family channel proteins
LRSLPLWPALVAESIGTFALVFAGCGAIAVGALGGAGVAAAFGLAIMTMVYALGHVSGAHFNPAVTAAFTVGRHFPVTRVVPYWVAQITGAIAAATVLRISLGDVPIGVTQPAGSDVQAFVWECVLTFFLMLVIVGVTTDTRAVGQAAAIAIGGVVTLGSLVGGPVSGASMNPARSIGPALVSADLSHLWIYLVAPPIGAIAAVVVYRSLRPTTSPRPDGSRAEG